MNPEYVDKEINNTMSVT